MREKQCRSTRSGVCQPGAPDFNFRLLPPHVKEAPCRSTALPWKGGGEVWSFSSERCKLDLKAQPSYLASTGPCHSINFITAHDGFTLRPRLSSLSRVEGRFFDLLLRAACWKS